MIPMHVFVIMHDKTRGPIRAYAVFVGSCAYTLALGCLFAVVFTLLCNCVIVSFFFLLKWRVFLSNLLTLSSFLHFCFSLLMGLCVCVCKKLLLLFPLTKITSLFKFISRLFSKWTNWAERKGTENEIKQQPCTLKNSFWFLFWLFIYSCLHDMITSALRHFLNRKYSQCNVECRIFWFFT